MNKLFLGNLCQLLRDPQSREPPKDDNMTQECAANLLAHNIMDDLMEVGQTSKISVPTTGIIWGWGICVRRVAVKVGRVCWALDLW